MIIYIHGFGGSGEGGKAKILKEELKKYDNIIAPSLPSNPYLAILTLKELIESFLKLGWLYKYGLPPKPTTAFNKNLFLSVLREKLSITHKDRDKRLIQNMTF